MIADGSQATMIDEQFDEHVAVAIATKAALSSHMASLARKAAARIGSGGKIVFFGNGGSAADAQHLAADLTVRFRRNRRALPALALTTDTSVLTACSNDLGFEELFARQVEALVRREDMVVGITTSGRSTNVLRGLSAARAVGALTVGLTGQWSEHLQDHCDVVLSVPSVVTARIQEMHILLGHLFCVLLENELGLSGDPD
jgi:D-sedoheptulose 7-phosphate isomerase